MDWGTNFISGSQDKSILLQDFRMSDPEIKRFKQHQAEVCGLKFSPQENLIASGGNDNKVHVFSLRKQKPILKYNHEAGVKALTWSKRQHNVLYSGGGALDKTIQCWNLSSKTFLGKRKTGSQICSLLTSEINNNLISAGGYPDNVITIWSEKDLKKKVVCKGHT